MIVTLLVVMGAGRLRIPRWSFLALAAVVWIGCVIKGTHFLVVQMDYFMPALFVGTVVGGIAARRGLRHDGDIAMAIIVGCALFQWWQPPKTAPEAPKPHIAIKLDTKLYDACVGQYEFAPDNVFSTGLKLTIWRRGDQLVGQAVGKKGGGGAFEIYQE
jgi:hypothetical protein